MTRRLIDRALRLGEARQFKDYEKRVSRINDLEEEMRDLEDHELREEADTLREHARNGEPLDVLLPDAFALCREAAQRTVGMRHLVELFMFLMVIENVCIAVIMNLVGWSLVV
jgi:preprotein translocase subunit SecA